MRLGKALPVQLAGLDGLDVVYLQKISGRTSTRTDTRVGGRMPATCTGSGKVLLAFADPKFRDRLITERGLPARTSRSITDRGVLNDELRLIRQRKYAVDREEFQIGTTSVAAPIFHNSTVLVATTVSIPADRLSVHVVVPTPAGHGSRHLPRTRPRTVWNAPRLTTTTLHRRPPDAARATVRTCSSKKSALISPRKNSADTGTMCTNSPSAGATPVCVGAPPAVAPGRWRLRPA